MLDELCEILPREHLGFFNNILFLDIGANSLSYVVYIYRQTL